MSRPDLPRSGSGWAPDRVARLLGKVFLKEAPSQVTPGRDGVEEA